MRSELLVELSDRVVLMGKKLADVDFATTATPIQNEGNV
jgi:tRNA nucleotidyltransferase/poly(A) polymerase